MTIEDISRIIQLILAPVVMITSCAILVSGMLTVYAATNDRMRALTRERLDLLHGPQGILSLAMAEGNSFKTERLHEIDAQLPRLLRRHETIHRAVLAVYSAILIFVASMFIIAAAAIVRTSALATFSLVGFLAGTAVLLAGILLMASEVRTSNQAVQYEVSRVLLLGTEAAPPMDHPGAASDA
jgi:hypothetical protein